MVKLRVKKKYSSLILLLTFRVPKLKFRFFPSNFKEMIKFPALKSEGQDFNFIF